jgi:hypothetical protein
MFQHPSLSLADFLQFPTPHWMQEKSAKIYISLVASGMIFQGPHAGVFLLAFLWSKIAASKTLESVTGRIF